MNQLIWVVVFTITLAFAFRKMYIMGYKMGATRVLNEWKKTLNESGDEHNG